MPCCACQYGFLTLVEDLAEKAWAVTVASSIDQLASSIDVAAMPTRPTVSVEAPSDRDPESVPLGCFTGDGLTLAGLIQRGNYGHTRSGGPEPLGPAQPSVHGRLPTPHLADVIAKLPLDFGGGGDDWH